MIIQNIGVLEENYIPKADEFLVKKQAEDVQYVLDNFTSWQSNLLVWGYSGSGKTCTVRSLAEEKEKSLSKATEKIAYLNLNKTFSELDTITEILNKLGITMTAKTRFDCYKLLSQHIKTYELKILIILDEIEKILENKSGSSLLYNLLESGVSIIAITNDKTIWEEQLETKTKSRFGIKDVFFKPYNIEEINEILQKRTEKAFPPNFIEAGAIMKLSSLCFNQNISLRQAISTLKMSAEIADKMGTKIKEEYIEDAMKRSEGLEEKELITTLPPQARVVLESMLVLNTKGKIEYRMDEIYDKYCELTQKYNYKTLSLNRMADFIWTLEKLGIINSRRLARSRGREKIITFKIPPKIISKILNQYYEESDNELKIQKKVKE